MATFQFAGQGRQWTHPVRRTLDRLTGIESKAIFSKNLLTTFQGKFRTQATHVQGKNRSDPIRFQENG